MDLWYRMPMIVYVSVCEDSHLDSVVRVHNHPEPGREAIQEWVAETVGDDGPIDYEDHDEGSEGIVLIVTIGEGTPYEGRYQAAMYRCKVE